MTNELTKLLAVMIPVISSSVLFVGLILTINIYLHNNNRFYLTVIFAQLTAFFFVLFNTMLPLVHHFSTTLLTWQFRRMEELAISFFLVTIPIMSLTLLSRESFWYKLNKVVTISGAFLLVGLTLSSFIWTDLFIPLPDLNRALSLSEAISQGREGILLTIREFSLLSIFLLSLLCILMDKNSRVNTPRFSKMIIAGLTLALIFVIYDFLFSRGLVTNRKGLNSYHIYSILATTIFTLFFISAFIRNFVLKARKLEETSIAYYKSEIKFKQFADNIDEVLWIIEFDGAMQERLLYINPAYEKVFRQKEENLYSDYWSWTDSIHSQDRELVLSRVKTGGAKVNFEQEFELEYRIVHSDGEICWISDRFFPVRDDRGELIRVARTSKDITRRKKTEEKLSYLAYYDPLTGLMNRKSFYERFEDSLNQARRARFDKQRALLFIDLHNLKQINDSLGHSYGDLLIQEATTIMKKMLRRSDYIFRYGGDEFVIILNQISNTSAAAIVAEKIIESLSKPFIINKHYLYLGSSIGIALFPQDGDDMETLIKKSGTALHQAKRDKNTYKYYTSKMEREALDKLHMINDLRKAIEQEQFALNFQPILDYNKKLLGAEVLLRWPHPSKGLISPARFIPVAEESMLICPIGEWVLNKAFRLWQDNVIEKGYELYLSFNLSVKQFKDNGLIDNINRAVSDSGLSPHYLHIEVTESSLMEDIGENIKKLEGLKKKGASISIDDFGTGYSSLNYLEKLPIDTIKIDRSFISGIPNLRKGSPIVEIILDMANRLGKKVIIEGVEVEEQWSYLKDLHFHGGLQGYYFSKPLAIEHFLEFIKENAQIKN